MNSNRFFFRCASCFFRFSADVEGLRAPQVGACVVCGASWVRCFGATKGVLSIGVPCNDACVFAESPDCSCACAGKNHGSRLLIPVLRGVVDFDKGKFPTLEAARREWEKWRATVAEVKSKLGPESQARRELVESLPGCYHSKAWTNRHKLLGQICKRLGVSISGAAVSMASASLIGGALPDAPGELFAWGEKWAHVSPQFRGHQFNAPAVYAENGALLSGAVSFSPQS